MGRVRTGKALVSREQCKPGAGTVPKRTLEVGAEAREIFRWEKISLVCRLYRQVPLKSCCKIT